jgi:hypothetical protein
MRIVIVLSAFLLMAASTVGLGADDEVKPAPDADAYRAAADLELRLTFQGIAEGGISRTLRLFGGTGRCEAWYEVSEVIARPPGHEIAAGDRLWLRYSCDRDRRFRPGPTGTVSWGRVGPRPYEAVVWLRAEDVERDRRGTWAVENLHDWLAPLAIERDDS